MFYLSAHDHARYSALKEKMGFDESLFPYTIRHLVENGLVEKEKSRWKEATSLDYRLTPLGKEMLHIITKMSRLF